MKSDYYQSQFHRSVIPQWLIETGPLQAFLEEHELHTPVAAEAYANSHQDFLPSIAARIQITDVNATACQLYQVDECLEEFNRTYRNDLSCDTALQLCYAVLSIPTSKRRHVFYSHLEKIGQASKTLWTNVEVPGTQQLALGLLVSAVDVTPVETAEKELEERQQFLSTVLKTVPDFLMIFDFERRESIFQNDDIALSLGYSPEEIEQTQGNFVSYITHPDDKLSPEEMLKMHSELAADEVFSVTIRLQDHLGNWRHFYFRSAALERDEQDNVINAVVVARDITDVLKTRQILSEQQRRYQLLADSFSDVVITTDTLFRVNYISPSVRDVLGFAPADVIKDSRLLDILGLKTIADSLARRLADSVMRPEADADSEPTEIVETFGTNCDGELIPLELKLSILRDEHNLLEGMLIVARDITERRQNEAKQRMAAKVFENSLEGVYITNADGVIVQVNRAFSKITGHSAEAMIGEKPSRIGSGWHEITFSNDIKPSLDSSNHWEGELLSRRANGEAFVAWLSISAVYDSRDEFLGLITSFKDITEAKNSEENIKKLAYYDPLTDLPNRALFSDRLSQALQRARRNRHFVALLFLDLDGFKAVNDTMGHALGDRLLIDVARRLRHSIRSDDTVARMGGDEFIVVLNTLVDRTTAENAAAQVAQKIVDVLNDPFFLQGKKVQIGCSIGIALYPDDSIVEDQLIKHADTAMYHAKEQGKNGYQFFTSDMHNRAQLRQDLERDLRLASLDEEFYLAYQPKFDARTRCLTGFEALLRWNHPKRGLLKPAHFLRTAEDLGMGTRLGDWVVEKACWQLREWLDEGYVGNGISINTFERHYRDKELVKTVRRALQETCVPAELLTVEISENILMQDIGFAYATLSDLRDLGVHIAIDDFALGMSSLQYLNRLPVNELKIDRQIISHVAPGSSELRLVSAIAGIALSYDCNLVAEGVERQEQLDLLLEANCGNVQGFLFSKPMQPDEVLEYLQTGQPVLLD
ncbi:putative signaling protein [BD1-7 clade bacterium]|uniref:Putative signaling protein n=1 Tax=BD1-7 clade bacterium TaxID=2029982 RepID=A0A5S9QDM5_9GAMM|nr:putative signaling protein [BD1-7 clade bacterium]